MLQDKLKKNVARITGPLFRLSTTAQESQQSASRGRVLAFYRIALCLREMMSQSYPIYAYTSAYHAHYLSVRVTFCGSSKRTLLK